MLEEDLLLLHVVLEDLCRWLYLTVARPRREDGEAPRERRGEYADVASRRRRRVEDPSGDPDRFDGLTVNPGW